MEYGVTGCVNWMDTKAKPEITTGSMNNNYNLISIKTTKIYKFAVKC